METAQRLLLGAFLLCAAFTALQQLRYGMLCGRAEGENRQEDPKVRACRRLSTISAVAGAVCLVICMALGALNRMG